MRILLVGDYPNDPRLGSAKVPHKLVEEFRALGHVCEALFAEDLGDRPRNPYLRHLWAPILAERAVRRAFERHGPFEVVDIASAEGLILGWRRRLGAYRGTALISRSNGLEHLNYHRMLDDHRAGILSKPWYRRLWYPLVRLNQVAWAARTADKLLVLNALDRDFAVKRAWKKPNDIAIIGHGVSDRFLHDGADASSTRGEGILFCGTWTGVKGVDYLAPAFAKLGERGVHTTLTILGGGVPAEQIRAAFPEACRNRVRVLERVPEEEVIASYRRHDVLVFPSTYEGFGMVVLEAMSQGLPVVATPVGCAATLVKDGETGLLAPPRDSGALADAMEKLLVNPALRQRLANNAWGVVSNCSWRRTALATLDLYEQALAGRGTS